MTHRRHQRLSGFDGEGKGKSFARIVFASASIVGLASHRIEHGTISCPGWGWRNARYRDRTQAPPITRQILAAGVGFVEIPCDIVLRYLGKHLWARPAIVRAIVAVFARLAFSISTNRKGGFRVALRYDIRGRRILSRIGYGTITRRVLRHRRIVRMGIGGRATSVVLSFLRTARNEHGGQGKIVEKALETHGNSFRAWQPNLPPALWRQSLHDEMGNGNRVLSWTARYPGFFRPLTPCSSGVWAIFTRGWMLMGMGRNVHARGLWPSCLRRCKEE